VPARETSESGSLGAVEPGTIEGQAHLVTDARGTYRKVQLPAGSSLLLAVDPAIVDPSVETEGFTPEDTLAAQRFVASFVATEVIDSTALDSGPDGYKQWVTATGQNYWQQQWREGIVAETQPALVNNTAAATIPIPYVRDSKPRMSKATIELHSITAATADYGTYLKFDGSYDVDYRASNSDILAAYEAAGYSRQDAIATLPDLAEESGESTVNGTMTFAFGVVKTGDQWLLSGYQNDFDNSVQK